MSYAKYIKVNEHGDIVAQKVTKHNPGKDWRKLTKEEVNLIARGPKKFCVDINDEKKKGKHRGKIKCRDFITLELADRRFPADGKSILSINVRGENLKDNTQVKIEVNDEVYTAAKKKHLEIVTNEPGMYKIRLVDPRFWTHRPQRTVIAYDPKEQEESSNESTS